MHFLISSFDFFLQKTSNAGWVPACWDLEQTGSQPALIALSSKFL